MVYKDFLYFCFELLYNREADAALKEGDRMEFENILLENGMHAAFLTAALLPFFDQYAFHEKVLEDPKDIPVALYLDLFDRFERLNKVAL